MGQLWLGQYGFNNDMVLEYNIREIHDGILLPFGGYTDINRGYQLRRYDKKPKYITTMPVGLSKSHYLHSSDVLYGHTLVVVEDLLSAYKLHYAGYSTLCLLGTKLDKGNLPSILLDKPDRVVLWLDDDEAGHMGAMQLFKELSPVFKYITSINMLQPKEISLSNLREMDL
jgi:DNA primase